MSRNIPGLSIPRSGSIPAGLLGFCLLIAASPAHAAERIAGPQQLQKLLNRYPEADADKNGVLTLDEARAHLLNSRSGQAADSKPANDTAISDAVADERGEPASEGAKRGARNFDMAAYLEQLSAKGKERGYKEHVYKQTPQGELRIYFAMPEDWSPEDKRPAVVFFYGGGWSGGNVFSYDEQSEYFAQCGVVAGMADYRVRTRHGVLPDKCVEDARSAVRWIRANSAALGVDPDRIIAGGGSAGAHVAACTAIPGAPDSDADDLRISCIPNGLILCFPVASLMDDTRASSFQALLGRETANLLSPARQVAKSWPPTVLFYGTADRLLPGGVLLHNNARQVGSMCEMYLAEGQGHGYVNAEPWNVVSAKYAADFFMRAGVLDKGSLPETPPDELRLYNGEPIEAIFSRTGGNLSRKALAIRGGQSQPAGSAPIN